MLRFDDLQWVENIINSSWEVSAITNARCEIIRVWRSLQPLEVLGTNIPIGSVMFERDAGEQEWEKYVITCPLEAQVRLMQYTEEVPERAEV